MPRMRKAMAMILEKRKAVMHMSHIQRTANCMAAG